MLLLEEGGIEALMKLPSSLLLLLSSESAQGLLLVELLLSLISDFLIITFGFLDDAVKIINTITNNVIVGFAFGCSIRFASSGGTVIFHLR